MQAHTYLNFDGNCRQAMEFYAGAFGAEDVYSMTFAEAPADVNLPANGGDRILHFRLAVGKLVLMGSDCPPGMPFHVGNNFAVMLDCDREEQVDEYFALFSEGGMVIMPVAQTFWGARFGMVRDQFQVTWMFSHSKDQHGASA